jgi:AcrR family transcriptional regulator
VGSNRDETWKRVRAAGVDLLYRHGFEAMNTRQLAEAAGLKPGSLYYYFPSKEEFLHRLLVDLLDEIIVDLERNLDGLEEPVDRLDAYVRTLVRWHVVRREETFIASIEVRSLTHDRQEAYMQLRDRFDVILADILRDGAEDGVFDLTHPRITRNAILSSLTAISSWYDPAGPFGLDVLTADFLELARRMVGLKSAG